MTHQAHWDAVYLKKSPMEVSWYQPKLDHSLRLIDSCALPPSAALVDVGGGASTLVDDLLERGFRSPTVIDLAPTALARSQARLGDDATKVRWLHGDITEPLLAEGSIDLWHDRAVFHFLTTEEQRLAYVHQLKKALRPGGYALVATFAPDGPERCSGLPVVRYSPAGIAEALGMELLFEAHEPHHTPSGSTQSFAYALCRQPIIG